MHLHCYLITLAESAEDAKSNSRIWIDDYAGREFFDYGKLEVPEKVVLLNEIKEELEKAKADTLSKFIPQFEKCIAAYKEKNDKRLEGYYHIQLGKIMSELPCSDMPFFNITDWDWSIPIEVPADMSDDAEYNWYAVMVDLHH